MTGKIDWIETMLIIYWTCYGHFQVLINLLLMLPTKSRNDVSCTKQWKNNVVFRTG